MSSVNKGRNFSLSIKNPSQRASLISLTRNRWVWPQSGGSFGQELFAPEIPTQPSIGGVMLTIALVFLTLVSLPIVIASAFRTVLIDRKSKRLKQEISELSAEQLFKSVDDGDGIENDIELFFSKKRLLLAAAILTFIYFLSFWFVYACLAFRFPGLVKPAHEFPEYLLKNAAGLSVAFLGVFIFNLGAFVCRLFLFDFTDLVF